MVLLQRRLCATNSDIRCRQGQTIHDLTAFSLNCSLYSLFSQIVHTMFQDNGSTSTTALCDRLSKMLSPSANRTYSSTLSENSASTLHEERLFLSRLFLFAKDKMSVKFGKCAYKLKANSAFVIFFI